MNRRDFLRAAGVGGLTLMTSKLPLGAATKPAAAKPTKRPNIVFVIADQLGYQHCGYGGDKFAQTPNIDRLAAQGLNFRQAVSSMPVCSAYRASLFTGKYTTSTGMVINELRMNTHHTTIAHVLTKSGYKTGYIGKWHLYANQLGNHLDPRNSFVPRGPNRLGFDGYWAAYNFHHDYYDTYYHEESPEKIPYGKGVYEPDAQTDMAINFIKKNSKGEDPFFLVLSVGTPHDPWSTANVPADDLKKFESVKFPLPPNHSTVHDAYCDSWSRRSCEPDLLQKEKEVYYGMTTNLDRNLGKLMDALEKEGIAEDTILVFTSDHGEMFGAHGRRAKNIFYEEASRVPFLLRYPRKVKGAALDTCLNTVDIAPTLLDLCGLGDKIPAEMEGTDVSQIAAGKKGKEPDAALLMNTGACASWEDGHEWRALRDKKFTYAVFRGNGQKAPRKELLFDNVSDPYQMKDLSTDPAQAKTMEKFRAMLKDRMAKLNDKFPASSYYKDNWTKDRMITASAKGKFAES